MKPISLAEKLMFNTVRIETLDGSSGTGFFFNFKQENTDSCSYYQQNMFSSYNRTETVKFLLHLREEDDETKENYALILQTEWFFILKRFVFIYKSIFEEVKKKQTGKEVFYLQLAGKRFLIKRGNGIECFRRNCNDWIYPIGLWDNGIIILFFERIYGVTPAYDF